MVEGLSQWIYKSKECDDLEYLSTCAAGSLDNIYPSVLSLSRGDRL